MIDLVATAQRYYFADRAIKAGLFEYYNEHCFPLVKPSRRYRIQPNDNWCAMFTSVIAHKEGLGVAVFPYEVSVQQQLLWAKENDRFTTDYDDVRRGDLILYDWNYDGWCDHVGFVIKVDSSLMTAIEGNKNDTVAKRTISTKSKGIYGYIKVGAL